MGRAAKLVADCAVIERRVVTSPPAGLHLGRMYTLDPWPLSRK